MQRHALEPLFKISLHLSQEPICAPVRLQKFIFLLTKISPGKNTKSNKLIKLLCDTST